MISNINTYLKLFALWTLFRCIEMVVLERVVTYNIIINHWVSLWSEVPWFLLWVIWAVFKPCQFVLKINHIICLFISKGIVFIFSQLIDKCFFLCFSWFSFCILVRVNLSYRIVPCFLSFDKLICYFYIFRCFTLEFFFLLSVVIYRWLPVLVVVINWEKDLIRCRLSYLLVLCAKHCHT